MRQGLVGPGRRRCPTGGEAFLSMYSVHLHSNHPWDPPAPTRTQGMEEAQSCSISGNLLDYIYNWQPCLVLKVAVIWPLILHLLSSTSSVGSNEPVVIFSQLVDLSVPNSLLTCGC